MCFRFWDFVDSASRDHVGPFVSPLSHPPTIFVHPVLICAGVWPPQLVAPAPLCLSSRRLCSPEPQLLVSSPHCPTSSMAFRPAQGPLGLLARLLLSRHLWAMPWGSQGSHWTEGEGLVCFDVSAPCLKTPFFALKFDSLTICFVCCIKSDMT